MKYIINATDKDVTLTRRENVHNGFLDCNLGSFTHVAPALREIAFDADQLRSNHYHIEVKDARS